MNRQSFKNWENIEGEGEAESKSGASPAMLRLPYALAKERGLSTDGMTPRQVWEMLRGRGVIKEAEEKKFLDSQKTGVKDEPRDEPEQFFEESGKGNSREAARNSVITSFEEKFMKSGHENGLLIDDDGNVLLEKRGNTNKIKFIGNEIEKMNGAHFTHNHPQSLTMLSGSDIQAFWQNNMRSVRCIGYDGSIHAVEIIDYVPKPISSSVGKYNGDVDKYNADRVKYNQQRERVRKFMFDYEKALNAGERKAVGVWKDAPKVKVKTGSMIASIPEGWTTYRKGASPRYPTNYTKFTEIIRDEIIKFSEEAEKKYGIRTTFTTR